MPDPISSPESAGPASVAPFPRRPEDRLRLALRRLDEAIGTELQILSSLPLIARTLKDEPHPQGPAVADLTAQDVLERLDVKRIEGSTIVALELLDERSDWAARFLDRLIAKGFSGTSNRRFSSALSYLS